jgi:hypothetical protein
VATGAGLHTAAYYVEEQSVIGSIGSVFSVVIPVAVYITLVYLLYALMVRTWDRFHVLLVVLTGVVLVAAVVAAAAGVPMAVCLLIATLAPAVSVVGFEVVGHRHAAAAVAASVADGD